MEKINPLAYRLGGLLYMPAFQKNIAEKIALGKIPCLSSVAFCLEDSIRDGAIKEAEEALGKTFRDLSRRDVPEEKMPLLFLRVRSPEQILRLCKEHEEIGELLTGCIFPKFDTTNAKEYLAAAEKINVELGRKIYIMPILETARVADATTRRGELAKIREILESVRPLVLNVRVGANDLCNLYGLRRGVNQTIYDLAVIRDILADVLNFFARDYVVSGAVWEYFGASGGAWSEGLRRETELDVLNGFVGKTAIHPCQLPIIAESLAVSREEYEDACALLDWKDERLGVKKSVGGGRMNELKCHERRARRIKILGDIYGRL